MGWPGEGSPGFLFMTTAWIVITEADLKDYLVAAQEEALASKALGTGQTNPFTNLMHDQANSIRAQIASRMSVSATAYSIPPELKWVLCVRVLQEMQTRIAPFNFTDSQKRQLDDANKLMADIVKGDVKVTMPPDPITGDLVQFGSPAVVVSSRTRTYTMEMMDGL